MSENERWLDRNGQSILLGDVTPSAADHTDFGSATVGNGSVTRTFIIANTGAGVLTLSGAPRVQIDGAHASDFTVTALPATSVSAGNTIIFQVTFSPGAAGARSATLTILNNDGDENDYVFSIRGTGLGAANVSEVFEVGGNTTPQPQKPLSWGARVSPGFRQKVVEISTRLGIDPSHLMGVIALEAGGTFSPKKQNKTTRATGLIQFLPRTAKALGTSIAALKAMSAEQQLDYIEKHLTPYKGKMKDLGDVYMAILKPTAIGKPGNHVLFKAGTNAYKQNAGLDKDHKNGVSKSEAAAKVVSQLKKGLQPKNAAMEAPQVI